MIFARDPRALLCLNLRKEWAGDQREIAAELERQAWCLEQARQSGWTVFHAHETRGREVNPALRGALRGLAPRRSEPVFVVAGGVIFANDTLHEAVGHNGARCVHVMGIGRSAALTPSSVCDVRVIADAFVELGEAAAEIMRRQSGEVFSEPRAQIVDLEAWRRERTRASEGVE